MPLNSLCPHSPDTTIRENYPLSGLTTLGTGGTAEFFAQPATIPQLQETVRAAKNIPVYVIGGGSNIIIPDGEIPGLVISTRSLASFILRDKFSAEIESGYSFPHLTSSLSGMGWGGLEFAVGIPGTLGGAIMGNAGAGGHGVCEFVESVNTVGISGELRTYRRGEFEYSYRHCGLSGVGEIIASAVMRFRESSPGDKEEYLSFADRRRSQPTNSRSAGCTFKNPPGYSAGKLLDECGCKGLTVGGAIVSEKHANFILNTGNASSSDVMELAGLCAERVHERTGITLEQEIRTLSPCFCTQ